MTAVTETAAVASGAEVSDDRADGTDPLPKDGIEPSNVRPAEQAVLFTRLFRAYKDDWHPPASAASAPLPAFSGYPMPVENPPFRFNV